MTILGFFDSRSHQRELFTAALEADIKPVAATLDNDNSALMITWPDLDEPVTYDGAFLQEFSVASDPMALPAPTISTLRSRKRSMGTFPSCP